MQVECIWQGQNNCGEGPVWHEQEQRIYWIDIPNGLIQALDPVSKDYQFWQFPAMLGAFSFREQGGIIMALRTGLAFGELGSEQLDYIVQPIQDNTNYRFNDAKCDRAGRYFAGTMDMTEATNQGVLYRLDVALNCRQVAEDYVIANGLGFSPDNTLMYHADSSRGEIYRYDYDVTTGDISNRHVWVNVPAEMGYSDGLCVDSEGYIWCAMWQGYKVVRYTPDGQIDRIIDTPVANTTSCCFGGADMQTLFITSAYDGQSDEQRTHCLLAGSLFALKTDVRGLAEVPFKG